MLPCCQLQAGEFYMLSIIHISQVDYPESDGKPLGETDATEAFRNRADLIP